MLRAAVNAGTPLGITAKKIMDSGQLVSDDIINELVRERIQQSDCLSGFLLDGYPRTVNQAHALKDNHIFIDVIINIQVSDEEIIQRLSGRRVHLASGRVYHIIHHPPKKAGIDDITGEPLIQRQDDQEETIKKRLQVYHQQTKPVLEFYQTWANSSEAHAPKIFNVPGQGEVEQIFSKIKSYLKS